MGVKVLPRNNENFQSLMRRFNRSCEKENVVRDCKKRMEFEKPSDKRRRAKFRSIKNAKRHELEVQESNNNSQDDMFSQ